MPLQELKQQGVIVEKYMVEITRYPDGKRFVKMFPIGEQAKINKAKRVPVKQRKVNRVLVEEKKVEEI